MRIGYFSDSYLPKVDGISYSIENFRHELEALGHEVFIFAPRPTLTYREPSKHIIRFPAIKGLFFDDYLTTFFFPPQEMKKIEKLNLDLIHYHTPGQMGMFGAYFALRNNIPLVTTYHTDLFEYVKHYPAVLAGTIALSMLAPVITGGGMSEYRTALNSIKPEKSVDRWNQKIVERGVTMIHNHCDVVIAPSQKIKAQLEGWQTVAPIVILPTGIDKINTTEPEVKRVREQYGLHPADEVILFVGRIGTEKNIGLGISAFDHIIAARPQAKLLIVGTGEDLEAFKQQAEASGHSARIIFTGQIPREKLGAIYACAKIFAFPSVTDTQGLAVNEAARAGLPIVMVDHEVTEVMHDGQNGFYSKNNARQFASKIITLLSNESLRQRFSASSVKLAGKYSISIQTHKLVSLYEDTIKNHIDKPRSKTKPTRHGPWQA